MDSERPRLAKKEKNDLKALCEEWNTTLCPFASREDRKSRAELFLSYEANYQKHYPVIKAWTWPDAVEDPPLLNEEWLGITWVALHINDSFCVVALANDLERLEHSLLRDEGDMTTCAMWNALVNEVEGIEERYLDPSCKTPFSVVTVVSGNSTACKMSGDEASSAEFRAKMSCKFLQNEMKSGETFTFDKTIQTTISAFQHLFGREVEAYEIRAFAQKDSRTLGKELKQWRKHPDLDELLASINEPDNDDPDTLTPKKSLAARLTADFLKEGDGSSAFSGKSKAIEKLILLIQKRGEAYLKRDKERRDRRRKRREKVRKLRSKKARKEIGDAQDTVEHCAKYDEKVEIKRREKVSKLRSKKARKEIGEAQDTAVEHCAKYDEKVEMKRREKVRKLRSKKARKEIGAAQDNVEHCAKYDEKVEMKRKKKVRKFRSKKARKEIGAAQDTVEHCAKYDVAPENVGLDKDAVMQEANMEEELELEWEEDL